MHKINTRIDHRLLIILLVVFVQIVGASMVVPILPLYAKKHFNMPPEQVTILISAFFVAQFLAGPVLGRLSDRYGRIPILLVSQIGTAVSFLMLGFATEVWILFFARILDGITGGNIIVAQAYVTDITPREQRTQALGYIFLAFGVGFVVGPAIGGILATTVSYEAPYLVAAAAATIVVLMTWFVLEETVTPEQRMLNQQRKEGGLSFASVSGNMSLIAVLLVAFGAQFAFSLFQSTFSLFGEAVLFTDSVENAEMGIGLLLAMLGFGQIVTQVFLLRQLVTRFGEGPLIVLGGFTRGLSMLIIIVIALPVSAALALFLFAVGTGMQMPALQSLASNTVPDHQRGGVLGIYQSVVSLSVIFGSGIAGSMFAVSPHLPMIIAAFLFTVMLVPGFFLMRWAQRQHTHYAVAPTPAGD